MFLADKMAISYNETGLDYVEKHADSISFQLTIFFENFRKSL